MMVDGAAFCSNCGQSFSVAAAVPRAPMMNPLVVGPVTGGVEAIPPYAVSVAVPRAEYAGFWLRFLALLIDSVVMGLGFVLILIPLIFLTGLRGFLSEFRPYEDMNESGIFNLIVLGLLLATGTLVFTWLYHALMESSEWQATVGKKALGLVVTDMEGRRASFGRSSGRHFGKMLTNLIPAFLGYVMAGFTERKQALHDILAGCLVLRRNS
jgi:uncharacterized RDD family membrane protein YckC